MRRTRIAGVVSLGATIAIGVVHCQGATAFTVDVTTDLPCASVRGVAIHAGAAGTVEESAPVVVVQQCEGGVIGSLTLVPSGAKDARVSVKVVLAVDADVEACTADNGYRGCIVARRTISYRPHETLRIPIAMRLICRNVPCDSETTCSAAGICIAAQTDDGLLLRDNEPRDGSVAVDSATTPDAGDGSAPDADRPDAARPDAAMDAASDDDGGIVTGGADAGPLCGVVRCNVGHYCCGGVTNTAPFCKATLCGTSPSADDTVACTGRTSCSPAARCCEEDKSTVFTACLANVNCGVYRTRICETSADCFDGNDGPNCAPHPGKNYGYCTR